MSAIEWPTNRESTDREAYENAVIARCKAESRTANARFTEGYNEAHATAFIELLAHREVLDPAYLSYQIEMRLRWRQIEATVDAFKRLVWVDDGRLRTLQIECIYERTTTEAARAVMKALVELPENEPRETFINMLRRLQHAREGIYGDGS